MFLCYGDDVAPLFVSEFSEVIPDVLVVPAGEAVKNGNQLAIMVASWECLVFVAEAVE